MNDYFDHKQLLIFFLFFNIINQSQNTKVTSWLPPIDSWNTFQPSPVPNISIPNDNNDNNGTVNGSFSNNNNNTNNCSSSNSSSNSVDHSPQSTPTNQTVNVCTPSSTSSTISESTKLDNNHKSASSVGALTLKDEKPATSNQVVLPYGWETAIDQTGQPYFIKYENVEYN